MVTMESFLVLAFAVVVIGIIVWRRDVKAGRVMRTTMRGPMTVMRDRFAHRASPPGAATPPQAPASAAPPAQATPPRPDAGEGPGG